MPIRARYTAGHDETPDGGRIPRAYVEGIPARGLDEDEWDALTAEQRKAVRDSGLYEVRTDREMSPRREREQPAEGGADGAGADH